MTTEQREVARQLDSTLKAIHQQYALIVMRAAIEKARKA